VVDVRRAWERASAQESETRIAAWSAQSASEASHVEPDAEQAERVRTLTAHRDDRRSVDSGSSRTRIRA